MKVSGKLFIVFVSICNECLHNISYVCIELASFPLFFVISHFIFKYNFLDTYFYIFEIH